MLTIDCKKLIRLKHGESIAVTQKKNGTPIKGQGDVSSFVHRVSRDYGYKFTFDTVWIVSTKRESLTRCVIVQRVG